MGLMMALNAAVSGLRTTQAINHHRARTSRTRTRPGYTRRTMSPIQKLAGDRPPACARARSSASSTSSPSASFGSRPAGPPTRPPWRPPRQLDKLFGTPGEAGALDSMVNDFTGSLQALLNDSGSSAARLSVLDKAGVLASQISRVSESVRPCGPSPRPDRARRREGERAPDRHRRHEPAHPVEPSLNDPGSRRTRPDDQRAVAAHGRAARPMRRTGTVSLSTTAGFRAVQRLAAGEADVRRRRWRPSPSTPRIRRCGPSAPSSAPEAAPAWTSSPTA